MLKVLKPEVIKSLRSIKSVKPNGNWKLNKLEVFKLIGIMVWKVLTVSLTVNTFHTIIPISLNTSNLFSFQLPLGLTLFILLRF